MKKRTKWALAALVAIILIFAGKISITEVISPIGDSRVIQTDGMTLSISPSYADAKTRTPIYDYDALPGLHFKVEAASHQKGHARMEVGNVCVTARGKTQYVIDQALADYPENLLFKEITWKIPQPNESKEYGAYYFYWPKDPSDPYGSLGNKAKINVKAKVTVLSRTNEVLGTQMIESDFILERRFFYIPWWITVLLPRF